MGGGGGREPSALVIIYMPNNYIITDEPFTVNRIRGKDNLLITVGDSWTAGKGAYSKEQIDQLYKATGRDALLKLLSTFQSKSQNIFREYSWPWLLANMLDWDLVNLAEGGMSNTGCAKKLVSEFDIYRTVDFTKYKKVLLIFLMSNHERFSFYSDSKFIKLHPQAIFSKSNEDGVVEACYKFFFEHIIKNDNDMLLESRFALKTIETYCNANNIMFLYGSAFADMELLQRLYSSPANIHSRIPQKKSIKQLLPLLSGNFNDPEPNYDPQYLSPCNHPNREGYRVIAEALYNFIVKYSYA